MIRQEQCKVISQIKLAENIYELTLQGELVHEMKEPGQFVHLKISGGYDPMLRRPISIAEISPDESQFKMIYRAEGRGTALLSEKNLVITLMYWDRLEMGFRSVKLAGERRHFL